jgi:hypothetical protein
MATGCGKGLSDPYDCYFAGGDVAFCVVRQFAILLVVSVLIYIYDKEGVFMERYALDNLKTAVPFEGI